MNPVHEMEPLHFKGKWRGSGSLNTTIYFSLNKLETTSLEYINSFKTCETYTDLFDLK